MSFNRDKFSEFEQKISNFRTEHGKSLPSLCCVLEDISKIIKQDVSAASNELGSAIADYLNSNMNMLNFAAAEVFIKKYPNICSTQQRLNADLQIKAWCLAWNISDAVSVKLREEFVRKCPSSNNCVFPKVSGNSLMSQPPVVNNKNRKYADDPGVVLSTYSINPVEQEKLDEINKKRVKLPKGW